MDTHKPVVLNHNTVAVIHLFKRHDELMDMFLSDSSKYMEDSYDLLFKESAKQFLENLQGEYCIAFLQALKEQIEPIIKEWEDRVRASGKDPDKMKNTYPHVQRCQTCEGRGFDPHDNGDFREKCTECEGYGLTRVPIEDM